MFRSQGHIYRVFNIYDTVHFNKSQIVSGTALVLNPKKSKHNCSFSVFFLYLFIYFLLLLLLHCITTRIYTIITIIIIITIITIITIIIIIIIK